MCLTEYDEARTYAELREEALEEGKEEGRVEGRAEGRAEGKAEGREEGTIRTLSQLVSNGLLTTDQAAKTVGVTVSEYLEKAAKFQQS